MSPTTIAFFAGLIMGAPLGAYAIALGIARQRANARGQRQSQGLEDLRRDARALRARIRATRAGDQLSKLG